MSRGRAGPAPVWALVVVLLVAAVAVLALAPGDRVLQVTDAKTGQVLVSTPVEEGTPVVLTYTHSVERSRVVDAYVVDGTNLAMTRTEFHSYGWGLPASADVEREDGAFVAEPDRSYRRIHVKPGRVAGHRLRVGQQRYDLVALSDARTVTVRVERRSVARGVLADLDDAFGDFSTDARRPLDVRAPAEPGVLRAAAEPGVTAGG